jgi:tRNA (adenine-N(1)-)-methyltransferase non-catalytic subunit
VENTKSTVENTSTHSGTTYVVYESGNWGLLVASLLNLLPADGPKLIHLYPGHGVPCLIAPRALNFPQEKLSLLSSVNYKALIDKLEKSENNDQVDEVVVKAEPIEDQFTDVEVNSELEANQDFNVMEEENDSLLEKNDLDSSKDQNCDKSGDLNIDKVDGENRKRKMNTDGEIQESESSAKKPRWQLEAEFAADLLTTRKADGLIVVAAREHPVSIVLSLLPYLAPSRPLVVYCPHREPLLSLYAVLKGWETWSTNYGKCGGKDGIPRVANLRVVENWLRSYQVLPNRTHPVVNMNPGGGFILTGTVVDFNDE